MFKFIKLEEFSKENMFVFLEKEDDISLFSDISFDLKPSLKEKISSVFKEEKNEMIETFLWEENIEKLFICVYGNKKDKNLFEFLWWIFPKLPKKLALHSNVDKKLDIVDTCLLSKYEMSIYVEKDALEVSLLDVNIVDKDKVLSRIETIQNVFSARDLVNSWPNSKTPETIAKMALEEEFENIKVKVLYHNDIKKEGLNLIDAVWRWSEHSPCLVVFEKIVDKNLPTYGFVWKWITFDSWGINIKSSDWLYQMKDDMAWSATVYYTMKELDKKDLNVNIVWCIALAENMVWTKAYRPSDVIKAYNWKTVDIKNTDAEWRLVLADAMSYISKNYKIDNIITIATLTGACLMALWYNYAWIMWFNREIIDKLLDYSKKNEEKYFELPFWKYYQDKVKSDIADLANLADWVYAGSTIWGAFLSHFCDNWENFVHIDIAWTAARPEAYSIFPKWATGFWVISMSDLFKSL